MHEELSRRTKMAVYFCDPHSPWQRGSNENTNGLVRQYLPKGTDLSGYSQEQLDVIAQPTQERSGRTIPAGGLSRTTAQQPATFHPRSLNSGSCTSDWNPPSIMFVIWRALI